MDGYGIDNRNITVKVQEKFRQTNTLFKLMSHIWTEL